jgi:PAS domain S-box-containing protein
VRRLLYLAPAILAAVALSATLVVNRRHTEDLARSMGAMRQIADAIDDSAPDNVMLDSLAAELNRRITGQQRLVDGARRSEAALGGLILLLVTAIAIAAWRARRRTRDDASENRDALAEARAMLEHAGRVARIGGWSLDLETMQPIWSREVYAIHELEFGTQPSFDEAMSFFAPEARQRAAGAVRRAIEDGEPFDLEAPLITANGNRRWVRAMGAPEVRDGRCVKLSGAIQDLTDLENTRAELAQVQARLERAIVGSSDGLWEHEPNTGAMWYSDRFKELLGYTPEEFDAFPNERRSWSDRLHPSDREATLDAIEAHMRGEGPYDVRYRLMTRSGEYRWFRARGTAVRDAGGDVIRMSGSITDIHDQHNAESRLDLAIRASGIGLWDWDVPSGQTYFTDTFYTMLGYEPGELPMCLDTWKALCHPDDIDHALADVRRHLSGETSAYVNEHRLKRKDGSWQWIRDVGEVVERDEHGAAVRMIGMHIDIQELKEITSRLELAQSAANAGVWDWDIEKGTFITNDNYHTMLGEEPPHRELPLDYFTQRLHPDDAPYTLAAVQAAHASDEQEFDVEFRFRCANNAYKWIRSTGRVIERGPGERPMRMIGQHIDIDSLVSSRRHVEQLNELLKAQSERAGALAAEARAASAAKSEFLANMSHEIRTPMTAILGYTDLLAEGGALDPEQRREYIDTIQRNGRHLLSIINDVLDISKIEAGKMSIERIQTRPASIVHEVLSLMRVKAAAKAITLDVAFDSQIPETIESDPVRLRQILMNLVGNAVKFTEVGGVTLRCAYDGADGKLRFVVDDTGIGMSELQCASAFEAFHQGDSSMTRRFGGSGLGLRISRRLAQLLGGDITVRSRLGEGSTFTATIEVLEPGRLVAPASALAIISENRAAGAMAHGEQTRPLDAVRILLAEDGPDNQRLIAFHLRRAGAQVTIASNGRIAIEALTGGDLDDPLADPSPFDLLVTDMQMPELDGYETVRRLRAKGSTLPIVALTAHAMSGDEERCLEAGCDAYATKPIDKEVLLSTCLGAIAARQSKDRSESRPNRDAA